MFQKSLLYFTKVLCDIYDVPFVKNKVCVMLTARAMKNTI